MKVKSQSEVAQSCPTLCDPMDCSLPDSSVIGFSRQEYQSELPLPSPHDCLVGKESACNAGDPGSIPGSGRSPGEGNRNPLQCSCMENSMDRGAWQAREYRVAKSQT